MLKGQLFLKIWLEKPHSIFSFKIFFSLSIRLEDSSNLFLIERQHYSEQKVVLRHASKMHCFIYKNIFDFCVRYREDTVDSRKIIRRWAECIPKTFYYELSLPVATINELLGWLRNKNYKEIQLAIGHFIFSIEAAVPLIV